MNANTMNANTTMNTNAKKTMTNLEMLVLGTKEIANNHNFEANTEWEENGEVCIYGSNVPTICDVRLLCQDIHLPLADVESNDFGIDIYITSGWYKKYANKKYKKTPYGEMWRRAV